MHKIHKIKEVLHTRLFSNMTWLFVLNFSNIIIPYFTFPYICRIFSPEGFGVISFSLSFIGYFITLIDYGFDLIGAREIAIYEKNSKKISEIFTAIFFIKFTFFLISTIFIIMTARYVTKLFIYKRMIIIFLYIAFSHVLMASWLFQGLQKMKTVTIISLFIRTIFLASVFVLVKEKSDIYKYAYLYSFSFILIGIIEIIIAMYKYKIAYVKIQFKYIKEIFKDGFYVFMSCIVVKIMSSTDVFVLGLFYTSEYVGYYAGVSKITQVITMLFYPIGQAIFPYISKKYNESFNDGYNLVICISKYVVPIFIFISIIIVLLRKQLVLIVLGKMYVVASDIMIILAFLPLLSIISNFMGTQILVASGNSKAYGRAFLRGCIIQLALYVLGGYYFANWGVAFAAITGAIINLVLLYLEIKKIKLAKFYF